MHEISLLMSIINKISKLCEQNNWKRVLRVTLKVGHLRQIDPEMFTFAFSLATVGTTMESAEISIIEMPIIIKCRACDANSDTEDSKLVCPDCGSNKVDIISGTEFIIESIEIGG
jgi:hydrogenase nickel incorporation protein HypA/HybF